jgi:UPF0042 nucleotide-binding protein
MSNQALSNPAYRRGRRDDAPGAAEAAPVLLVTGISGAGKTSALKALEDLGFEAVDNVPLSLLGALVLPGQRDFAARGLVRRLAIGVDIRTRDFAVEAVLGEIDQLGGKADLDVRVLFLDCDDDELGRRFAETRHRHPLAVDRPVRDGIAHERRLLLRLRQRADLTVDTTGLGPGDLKRILAGHFAPRPEAGLAVFVTSFSYRHGLPREADLVFDVRFLANPHYDPELRRLTGSDPLVAEAVTADPAFAPFFDSLTGMLGALLPAYAAEGKSYLTIALGCTGGRHRSVVCAERLAAWLGDAGEPVTLHHRDMAFGAPGGPEEAT